jgi:acetyl esterase/lipase
LDGAVSQINSKNRKLIMTYRTLFLIALLFVLPGCNKSETPHPPRGYPNITMLKIAYGLKLIKPTDLTPAVPDSIEVFKNIEYKNIDHISLQLDIYRKRDLKQPAPLLVFIHGGGWRTGKREDYLPYLVDFAKHGYVTATVSYRLIKEGLFPAAVQDVKCAIKWLKSYSSAYMFDPDKIIVIGGSAGGHLAMMVGYSSDVSELESECGSLEFDSKVQGIVNIYGPMDLTTEYAKGTSQAQDFIGGTFEEYADKYRLASPITHITKDDPPTLIFHGTIDELVPIGQSDRLNDILQNKGIPVEYHRLKGWPHSMDVAKKVNEYCQYYMLDFFKRVVG